MEKEQYFVIGKHLENLVILSEFKENFESILPEYEKLYKLGHYKDLKISKTVYG